MGYIIDEECKLKLLKNQKIQSTILEKSKLKNKFKIFIF